jgi:hypothetical protein
MAVVCKESGECPSRICLRVFFNYHRTSLIVAGVFEKLTKSLPVLKKSAALHAKAIGAIAPSTLVHVCPRQGRRRPTPSYVPQAQGGPRHRHWHARISLLPAKPLGAHVEALCRRCRGRATAGLCRGFVPQVQAA